MRRDEDVFLFCCGLIFLHYYKNTNLPTPSYLRFAWSPGVSRFHPFGWWILCRTSFWRGNPWRSGDLFQWRSAPRSFSRWPPGTLHQGFPAHSSPQCLCQTGSQKIMLHNLAGLQECFLESEKKILWNNVGIINWPVLMICVIINFVYCYLKLLTQTWNISRKFNSRSKYCCMFWMEWHSRIYMKFNVT